MANLQQAFQNLSLKNEFLNLKHKPFTLKDGEWYNLETSRRLTNIKGKTYLVYPPVAGEAEMIVEFLFINRITLNQIKYSKECLDLANKLNYCINQRKPRLLNYTHIDQIPNDELERMTPFTFSHIMTEAKVTRVIDGDTFECVLLLNPEQLAYPIATKSNQKTIIGQNCTLCSPIPNNSLKMLIKLKIRLFGADAADDPDTARKEAATQLAIQWCNQSNNCIWLQLMGYDCRSRILGDLFHRYSNTKDDISFTTHLLNYRHPKLGAVAKPYYGGNKGEAWNAANKKNAIKAKKK